MYKIKVSGRFSAAHSLIGYNGPCKQLHGHNFKVVARFLCADTDEIGLTVDFTVIKKALHNVLGELDHQHLNDLAPFAEQNPTSENLARYIYHRLREALPQLPPTGVEVWEGEDSSVTYFESCKK